MTDNFPSPGRKIILLIDFSKGDAWYGSSSFLAKGSILTTIEMPNDALSYQWLAIDENQKIWVFATGEYRVLSPLEQLAMEAE